MRLSLIILLTIGFGSMYTIFRKYQSVVKLKEQNQQFNQPLLQAFFIFIGMCLIYFFRPLIPQQESSQSKKPQSKYIYLIPSIFDVLGTISDTAGLFYTSVSVSQMLKGFVLFFTYLISILRRKDLSRKKHVCMMRVFGSLILIGLSNIHSSDTKYQSNPQLGNFLIILSQILFACMFVSEEYITQQYNIQVSNAILWEGIWGTAITGIAIGFFSIVSSEVIKCQILQSSSMIYDNTNLLLIIVLTGLCIAPFNYFGLYITKNSSALQRCLVCTGRMIVVWIASLCCNWESFSILQFFGYILLTYGIFEFNKLNQEQEKQIEHIGDEQEKIVLND